MKNPYLRNQKNIIDTRVRKLNFPELEGSIEQTIPDGNELMNTCLLNSVNHNLTKHEDGLIKRLKNYKYGVRDYKLMKSLIDKTTKRLWDTMPEKSIKYAETLLKTSELTMKPTSVTSPVNGMDIVARDDLEAIVDKAMGAECAICLRDGKQIERCKLRRALWHVLLVPDGYNDDGCPYQKWAQECPDGDYLKG